MRFLLALLAFLPGLALASVPLYWTPPTTNTDSTPIAGPITYTLYQGSAGAVTTKVQTGITGQSALVSSGLTPGTQTCFAVTAVVAGIESVPSNQLCVTIPPVVLTPSSPTNLRGAP